AGERIAFVDEACTDDPELRSQVESLLASDENAGGFLAMSAVDALGVLESGDSGKHLSGQRIGPYQIIREIGHGGMGTVYLAERADGQYRKRVAIKMINAVFGAEDLLRRFRSERQVLA